MPEQARHVGCVKRTTASTTEGIAKEITEDTEVGEKSESLCDLGVLCGKKGR
jgi:hypothetical protein